MINGSMTVVRQQVAATQHIVTKKLLLTPPTEILVSSPPEHSALVGSKWRQHVDTNDNQHVSLVVIILKVER